MSKFGQPRGDAASARPPFVARGWRGNRHYQTIWPNRIQRDPAGARLAARGVPAVITSEDGDTLRLFWSGHCDGVPGNGAGGLRPVLVVLHGLTGAADADNVMATAAKGYALGFDVVRVDLRNSQALDAPSRGIGHAGRSEDLRAIVGHVAERAPGAPTTVIGFSLGGNITLKALGEYGDRPPATLRAAATVSVPIDLNDACRAIDARGANWIYRTYFLRRLARRYLAARAQHPDLFHAIDVASIRGIRDWDNAVVAPLGGFADAEDYYARNSSLEVIGDIRVPTLLIHAQDDPFIPFGPFENEAVSHNDMLELLAPPQGGHVGFFATEDSAGEPDRYWAENRALQHCAAAVGLRWPATADGRAVGADGPAGAADSPAAGGDGPTGAADSPAIAADPRRSDSIARSGPSPGGSDR
jgi:hypothetical protein